MESRLADVELSAVSARTAVVYRPCGRSSAVISEGRRGGEGTYDDVDEAGRVQRADGVDEADRAGRGRDAPEDGAPCHDDRLHRSSAMTRTWTELRRLTQKTKYGMPDWKKRRRHFSARTPSE